MTITDSLNRIYAFYPNKTSWRMREVYAVSHLRYYAAARQALYHALLLAGLKRGDTLLLPSFICCEVLSVAENLGIGLQFYTVDRQLQPQLPDDGVFKAILAVNYFGFAQDLEPFRLLADKTGAVIIEDNAHGLFSRDEHGCLLGERTTLGIISQRKSVFIPDGGLLLVHKASGIIPPLQLPPVSELPAGYRVKVVIKKLCAVTGRWPAIALLVLVRKFRKTEGRTDVFCVSKDIEPNRLAMELEKLTHPETEAARRRELYGEVQRAISQLGGEPVFAQLPKGAVPYCYPFYLSDAEFPLVKEKAFFQGLDIFTWPQLPLEVAADCPSHYKNLRCVRFLW
jgi:hypothetical protein